jgi:hypothetical protein
MIVALPLCPSLVAAIVAVPTTSPVTTPAVDTVATNGASELQAMARPVSTLSFASSVVAVAWVLRPASIEDRASDIEIDATGRGVTVSVALPTVPSLVAIR